MHRGAQRPLPILWRRESRGSELVSVAAEDDNADAVASHADIPHGFEDDAAFVEIAGPCVGGIEAPVAGEGDGRDDEFPLDTGWFVALEEGEQGGQLCGA